MDKRLFLIFVFVLYLFMVSGVSAGEKNMTVGDFKSLSQEEIDLLFTKKIFFGHQSVGDNIVNGLMAIKDSQPSFSGLNIVKTSQVTPISSEGYFAHADVGENFDPLFKIDSFGGMINNGLGGKVDIAFMKFCFVDIGTESDLDQIFNHYKQIMTELKNTYPETTFVHVTVPLFVEPTGIKSYVKTLIKQIISKNNMYENTAKARLNQMIRSEYQEKEPVFDLAYYESTYADGKRLLHKQGSLEYESLIPEYSSDGGHLNEKGQDVLAKALLAFLAALK